MSTFAIYRRPDGKLVRFELVQKTDGHVHQELLNVGGKLVQEPHPSFRFIKWEMSRD